MLTEKTRELREQITDFWKETMSNAVKNLDFDILDDDDKAAIDMLVKCQNLLTSSCDLMEEQARTFDSINEKLDKILKQTTKEESYQGLFFLFKKGETYV